MKTPKTLHREGNSLLEIISKTQSIKFLEEFQNLNLEDPDLIEYILRGKINTPNLDLPREITEKWEIEYPFRSIGINLEQAIKFKYFVSPYIPHPWKLESLWISKALPRSPWRPVIDGVICCHATDLKKGPLIRRPYVHEFGPIREVIFVCIRKEEEKN